MSRHQSRLERLVQVARRREEQARQSVAVARSGHRASVARTEAAREGLRVPPPVSRGEFRLARLFEQLGREELDRAEGEAAEAARVVEDRLTVWQSAHQQLGTLERLDARLFEAFLAEQRRREQLEADELATTRRRSHP